MQYGVLEERMNAWQIDILYFRGETLLLIHWNVGNNTSLEQTAFFNTSQSNSEIYPIKKQSNFFYMPYPYTCCPAGLELSMQTAVKYCFMLW